MKLPKIIQLPSGNFHSVIMLDGQRVSITDETEDAVRARLYALRAGLIELKRHPDRIILKDACLKYIQDREGRLSPTTLDGYRKIVENSFPNLLSKRICDIDRRTLQNAVDCECKRFNSKGSRYTPKTINNRYSFIASVLKDYDANYPVRLPEIKDKPVFILTPEQVFEAVKGTEIELPVLLSMWLSFTMSEIRGLTKSKSIHGDQISVVETVVQINGQDIRKQGGKEQKRTRTLDIPPYIKGLIDKVEDDIIVPATPASITNRFYKLLKKHELPHISFHTLRHINASVMAELNIPAVVANQRGGWKTSYTRERVYTHTFSEERKNADRKIDLRFESLIKD